MIWNKNEGLLHRHPQKELDAKLNPDHVIVDLEDWKKVRHLLYDDINSIEDFLKMKGLPTKTKLTGGTKSLLSEYTMILKFKNEALNTSMRFWIDEYNKTAQLHDEKLKRLYAKINQLEATNKQL